MSQRLRRTGRTWRRALAAGLAAALLCTGLPACTKSPTPSASTPAPAPGPGESGVDVAWVPADLAADVAAIRAAATTEAAVAATRTVLEKSGVTVTGDPASVPPTPAAMYLSDLQLEAIAVEEHLGVSRTSFASFATVVGGAAGLGADEAVLDELADLYAGEPPSVASTYGPDLSAMPARMVDLLNGWVELALEHHGSAGPELARLTNPPLYLAALAAAQSEPTDLRRPFAAGHLRLSLLGITLLTAGLRAHLAHAAVPQEAGLSRLGTTTARRHRAAEGCEAVQEWLETSVSSETQSLGGVVRDQAIQKFIDYVLRKLVGNAAWVSKVVSGLFAALGVAFKIVALTMTYQHVTATVRLPWTSFVVHKPIEEAERGEAVLEAGITDDEWERARQQREADPALADLKACARLLGIPVTSDLVDAGESMKDWTVTWTIHNGANRLVPQQGEIPGQARPLLPTSDHTGTDIFAIELVPEKEEDHSGREYGDFVQVCADVAPRIPPDFVRLVVTTVIGAVELAAVPPVGIITIGSVIADLLVSWYSEVGTIQACADQKVTYHVPHTGPWHGRVLVTLEKTVRELSPYESLEEHIVVTQDYYLEAGEPIASDTITSQVLLHGDAQVSGYATYQRTAYPCGTVTEQARGLFAGSLLGRPDLPTRGNGFLEINPDGTYVLTVNIELGEQIYGTVPATVSYSGCLTAGVPATVENYDMSWNVNPAVGPYPLTGAVDPANPGNQLRGSQVVSGEGWTGTVTWDLFHDGPIPVPVGR